MWWERHEVTVRCNPRLTRHPWSLGSCFLAYGLHLTVASLVHPYRLHPSLGSVRFTSPSPAVRFRSRSSRVIRVTEERVEWGKGTGEGTEWEWRRDRVLCVHPSLLSLPSPSPYDRSCHSATLRSFTLLRWGDEPCEWEERSDSERRWWERCHLILFPPFISFPSPTKNPNIENYWKILEIIEILGVLWVGWKDGDGKWVTRARPITFLSLHLTLPFSRLGSPSGSPRRSTGGERWRGEKETRRRWDW